jgi:hypothetical protein
MYYFFGWAFTILMWAIFMWVIIFRVFLGHLFEKGDSRGT